MGEVMGMALLAFIVAVPTFFLWASIHEMTHFLAAKLLYGARLGKMTLYPHFDIYLGFVWASVTWDIPDDVAVSTRGQAAVLLAPRVPDVVAMAVLPWLGLFTGPALLVVLTTLLAGGLVDCWTGSTGIGANTDLRRAARYLMWSPWIFRVAGFAFILLSASGWLLVSGAAAWRAFTS